ncbi:hypothetical protein ABI59_18475 [Acidobacteria bacterium Mor1]|nr:hypothetical protein ABI59_18475 [Acidobacteria bacterium Mor1]
MTKKAGITIAVVGGLLALGTVALIVIAASQQFGETCEACVTFRGREMCREAQGATKEEAMRTAIDNACALLATGRKENIECTTKAPVRGGCLSDQQVP